MQSKWVRLAVAVLALVAMPAAAPTSALGEQPVSSSDNVEHVENVKFPEFRGSGARATDSDFTEFTIPDTRRGSKAAPEGNSPRKEDVGEKRPGNGSGDGRSPSWRLPSPSENGGIELPADYSVEAGERRVFNAMGSYFNGMFITDVTDPENPTVVSRWDCGIAQGDVFVFEQGDRVLAAYTLDATQQMAEDSACVTDLGLDPEPPLNPIDRTNKGTFIADITDPYRPQSVSFIDMRKGTHQVTIHPSGDYLYNSAAVVVTDHYGTIEVFDISNPEEPELASELELVTGLDSHDMTFSESGDRLYVAALTHSFVIDTTDPSSPEILGRIYDPAINIHHDAHAVSVETAGGERTFMLIGDELAGAAPTGGCPGGGIHVYDITGPLERTPVKVGAFFIPELRATAADGSGVATCTAHVIQPLPGTTLLSVAWYNAGVRILDYSGLADQGPFGLAGGGGNTPVSGIEEVGHLRFADSNLWSAKVHEIEDDGSFYIFGGDIRRHLDIFKFDPGLGGASANPGEWLTPEEARSRAATVTVPETYTPFCLLPTKATS